MKPFHLGLIDKRLAHKAFDENVFVCDLRRALPGTLPRDLVDQRILPELDQADQARFLSSYIQGTGADGTSLYSLSLVPRRIPSRLFSDAEGPSPFTPAERRTLERYYSPQGDWHGRSANLTEMEDVVLTHILEGKGLAAAPEDLIDLANLLESIPGLPREQVFQAGLHVSVSHPFFFEHPNEHVPGMMVLEAARQFGMACWHCFGGVPVQGFQFVLNQLHGQFFDYVDLNYPAALRADVRDLSQRITGEWEKATVTVTVSQGNGICAEVAMTGQVLSKRGFQRLRDGKTKTDPQHRFEPIPSIHHRLNLWNIETQKYHDARLVDLSLEGMGVEVSESFEDKTSATAWELFLYFEDVGFIRVRAALVWRGHLRGAVQLGFRFIDVSGSDKTQLQTVIRQYCHLHRGRERF